MSQAVAHFKAQGVTHFIFGDIFLHDVRKYREQQLAPHGIEVVEPLWGRSSETVMHDFLASGLQTVVVTTMADGLGAAAIGRTIDSDFIASLPAGTDPNGPPFLKRYFRGTPKAPAQRDFLAGMHAAPQVSANDATFSF